MKVENIQHRDMLIKVSQAFISSYIDLINIFINNHLPVDLIEYIFLLFHPNKILVSHLIYLVDPNILKKENRKKIN